MQAVFTVTLFTIAKIWKQSKHPKPMDGFRNKKGFICAIFNNMNEPIGYDV